MDGDTLLTIGELARRTGLTVKAIRFYSDRGIVPPTDRTSAGYRLYDETALARLQLVRTLRELDVDLATIARVLARELTLAEVAAAHADALDAQIRALRLQRTVMRMAARRDPDEKEIRTMHELATLSAEERRRIIDDFLDATFADLDADPAIEQRMRAARPDLPDDPSPEQVDAWIELAQLVRDDGFRRRTREMAEAGAAQRAAARAVPAPDAAAMRVAAEVVATEGGKALAAGVAPDAPEAAAHVAAIEAAWSQVGDGAVGALLADRLAVGTDRRAERYWQLLAIVNGWPPVPATVPAFEWAIAALRSR
ncbi:MerR family transcriptional regulator [Conexibacter arvalis]|uniref:DNA-binding transcriptional MerR regulator n=1 Tax=Conexibacter arvalis TaxID=912552 RepID=A0A840IAM6_9ACTN|nr:MerR family transcriptional regulator [Conexibacter arvalis]MBB4661967.1 DNA-binding transcriptional MerR regulator [Conexibacter arvalis]